MSSPLHTTISTSDVTAIETEQSVFPEGAACGTTLTAGGDVKIPSNFVLSELAKLIPADRWRGVLRALRRRDSTESDIENIEERYTRNLSEQKYQALLTWKQKDGHRATISNLDKALRVNKCFKVAEKLPILVSDDLDQKTKDLCNLLDAIINPHQYGTAQIMSFEILTTEFNKQYGKFRGQGVGSIKEFLKNSNRFNVIEKKGKALFVEQVQDQARLEYIDNREDKATCSEVLSEKQDVRSSSPIPIAKKCSGPNETDLRLTKSSETAKDMEMKLFLEDVQAVLHSKSAESDLNLETVNQSITHSLRQWSNVSSPLETGTPKSAESENVFFQNDLTGYSRSVDSSHRASPTYDISVNVNMFTTDIPNFNYEDTGENISDLLQRAADDVLTFHGSASIYIDDSHDVFMRDVVSMWNTPYRGNAHIVLGVYPPCSGPPTNEALKGILQDHRRENEFYQQMFSKDQFNNRPKFSYVEAEWDGNVYGLFTIFSSRGSGKPCVSQNKGCKSSIQNGEILCRNLSKNVLASGTLLQNVYKWFAHVESEAEKFDDGASQIHEPKIGTVFPVDTFLQATNNFEKRRSYCLVTNCTTKSVSGRQLRAFGLLPWLKVFDFDISSANTGVLAACRETIKKRRNVCITTWREEVRSLNHNSTEWLFPRGYYNKRESVCGDDDRQWNRKAGKKVDLHCQVLVEYCMARTPLTVVVLWYCQNGEIAFLDRFMRKLEDSLGSEMHAVLCYDKIATEDKGVVDSLQKILKIEIVEDLPLSVVCGTFEELFSDEQSQAAICRQHSEYCLPTYDKSNNPGISDVDAAWLSSRLDVLYLNDPHTSCDIDNAVLGQEFYRGGTLSWYEMRVSRFDVRRELEKKLFTCIDSHINKAKSVLLKLKHAPGSGGTTMAKRVLWEVHRMGKSPCACVTSLDHIKETVSQVDFLAEKTHLPVVLLIDGIETTVVRRVLRMLDRKVVIVLHVERQVSRMDDKEESDKFKLQGRIGKEEAPAMAIAFQTGCQTVLQHNQLAFLAKSIQDGHKHCLYEFGIAAHSRRYHGVKRYVDGYMELDHVGPCNQWQRTVAYLALVTYYGYMPMPAHFFMAIGLVNKSSNGTVSVDMLPHSARQFILEENDMGITKWRITHHIVANEIIEQVLNRTGEGRTNDENFSLIAQKKLAGFVSEFLKDASKVKLPSRDIAPPEIMKVLIATLIYRDSREIDVSQGDQPTRKPKLARLIRDIPSRFPYTERLHILKQFSQSFPEDPSVWAHLGRFYGNFRPNDEQEAQNCLERALSLRNQEIKEENERFSNNEGLCTERKRSDATLTKIYHMYGILQSRNISRQTGRDRDSGSNFKFEPDSMNQPNSKFHDKVEDVVQMCRSAVDHFVQCRDYVSAGLEESYGYVGEINVRLMVAEFVNGNYVPNGYTGYVSCAAANRSCQNFLSECFSESNRLILECYELVPQDELTEDFFSAVNWFNMLFNGAERALANWQGWDTITSRRCRIAAYKLKHSKKKLFKRIHVLDQVHSEADVKVIIDLHEQNIREIFEKGMTIKLDADILEWLQAIRHDEFQGVYKFEEVLRFVRMWSDTKRTPLAIYYLFVLNAVMGLGSLTQGATGSVRNFSEALRLLQELKTVSRLSSKPRLKRDWLGVYDPSKKLVGIKRLIRSVKIMHSDNHSNSPPWEQEEKQSLLEARKGTISSSKKPLAGYIDVDDGLESKTEQLKAFFIPKLTKFQGDRYRGQRVEFHVAFSMAHGLEAYNVSELKTYTCIQCKRDCEMSRLGKRFQHCRCGFPIRRDSDNIL